MEEALTTTTRRPQSRGTRRTTPPGRNPSGPRTPGPAEVPAGEVRFGPNCPSTAAQTRAVPQPAHPAVHPPDQSPTGSRGLAKPSVASSRGQRSRSLRPRGPRIPTRRGSFLTILPACSAGLAAHGQEDRGPARVSRTRPHGTQARGAERRPRLFAAARPVGIRRRAKRRPDRFPLLR